MSIDPIQLTIFCSRLSAVCDEMGASLRRAAFSPNIRDRLDYSCAIFDVDGKLCAQAAHIPVHLGSMAYAMQDIVSAQTWQPSSMLVLNDPYLGGTHLPDVTVVAPVFAEGNLLGFVANRAHHADIGADTPGSMPVSASLHEEGLVIQPSWLVQDGEINQAVMDDILSVMSVPEQTTGDFLAQVSANRVGADRLLALYYQCGGDDYALNLAAMQAYAQRLAQAQFANMPVGQFRFSDVLDDDGQGNTQLALQLTLTISRDAQRTHIRADFAGTCGQTAGNVNCPLSVTAAGVLYVIRCLLPPQTPACAGAFADVTVSAPPGSLLNATYPAAVAAGNVETSTRVVDLVQGALAQAVPERMPAASHGSMNNLAMGSHVSGKAWNYYETIGGGMGASAAAHGMDAVQTHMTNTLNTPVEVLETTYPLQLTRYAIRRGSGGAGQQRGGDGLIREYRFLAPASVTLLTERRASAPWGAHGGGDAQSGANWLNGQVVAAKITFEVQTNDVVAVHTPGGGGYGYTHAITKGNH